MNNSTLNVVAEKIGKTSSKLDRMCSDRLQLHDYYHLHRITSPGALHYDRNDLLAAVEDVHRFGVQLPTVFAWFSSCTSTIQWFRFLEGEQCIRAGCRTNENGRRKAIVWFMRNLPPEKRGRGRQKKLSCPSAFPSTFFALVVASSFVMLIAKSPIPFEVIIIKSTKNRTSSHRQWFVVAPFPCFFSLSRLLHEFEYRIKC